MDAPITVSQQMLIGVAAVLFGYLGFRRGINRELLQMIGIAISMWMSAQLATAMEGMVNRFYKLFRLMLGGGLLAADPTRAWQEVQALPDLVRTPEHVQMLAVVTFVAIALLFSLIGQYRLPHPSSLALQVMGACAGLINGFLASYYLFPILFNRSEAVIRLPSEEVHQTLADDQTIARMVALFVLVLIAFGLYTASTPKKR